LGNVWAFSPKQKSKGVMDSERYDDKDDELGCLKWGESEED